MNTHRMQISFSISQLSIPSRPRALASLRLYRVVPEAVVCALRRAIFNLGVQCTVHVPTRPET